MNKKQLSERDICTKFITPALEQAGWDVHTQVREEYALTKGRVIVRGKLHTRAKNKRAGYVLFFYEKILADLQPAGNAGEYYTSRAVTRFMVDIIAPRLGERILDPACGTGGFQTCAIEHLERQVRNNEDKLTMQSCIHGVEKKPLPHMLAMTNVMLHGIDVPTNILFFEKGGPTKDVWFFTHPYPEGYTSYSRSKPLTIEEFDRKKQWWGGAQRKGRKITEHAWKISAKEIAARNYNLDCKNPHAVQVHHGDHEELMAEYQEIVYRLEAAQEALKLELIAALGGEA